MNKISVDAMGMFTEYLRTDNADIARRWFRNNKEDFDREELVNLVDEFLTSMIEHHTQFVLEDAAIELDEKYDDLSEVLSKKEIIKMKGNYIITPYIVGLMQKKIPFLVFYDNEQLLEGDEVQEWLDNQSIFGNGILAAAERNPYMIAHHVTDRNGRSGYYIKDTRSIYSMIIPDEIIKEGYGAVVESSDNVKKGE